MTHHLWHPSLFPQALGKKGGKVAPPKVTAAQLAAARDAEAKAQAAAAAAAKKASKKELDERSYDAMVSVRNANRADDEGVDARGVDAAIAALDAMAMEEGGGSGTPGVDRHVERRLRGAYEAYEAAELPGLMEEKPGLKRQQYKELLWKSWQKSPLHPLNQARAAAAAAGGNGSGNGSDDA